jgi:hypothetical protein
MQKYHKCLLEEDGEHYCGLTIKWDYPGKKVHLSMPLYTKNGLKRFQQPPRSCRKISCTHTSTRFMGRRCNMHRQMTTPPCSIRWGKKIIQEATGVFLFLARAVDSTMLTPLSAIASKQAALTENTMQNMPPVFRLRSIAGRRHCHLPGQRYETCNPQ